MPKNDSKNIQEIGHIQSFFLGVAKIRGLPNSLYHEVLANQKGKEVALVIGFDEDLVEVLFFTDDYPLDKPVFRTGKLLSIPTSEAYIGQTVNGIGKPTNSKSSINGTDTFIFADAPQIIERKPISKTLSTGIKIIDATLPLGRGQRELIVGDRKLGKSTIAVDTILNQHNVEPPVICVYVLCGKKSSELARIREHLEENDANLYTAVVAAPAGDSLASQFLAPFVGVTIAEYFRNKGQDSLIIYDDLSNHAKVYRDISLLLERPPGREVYPGDIFSIHAGLLERSAQMSDEKGGGSLTAFPIIETQEGDLTSYIATNLISITDGQIYLERGLFQKQYLPAINVGLSVSRVSSQVQPKPLKEATKALRLTLAQQKELQKLTQLETNISIETQKNIHRGELILELLKQEKHTNVPWEIQVILFYAVDEGYFDNLEKEKWIEFENYLNQLAKARYMPLLNKIKKGKFDKDIQTQIKELVDEFKQEFMLTI